MLLQPDDTILFYGDSITDAGRRAEANNNHALGHGYPALLASALGARLPHLRLTVHNRGISGNRVYDLESRLEADCLALKPSLVSILIGINDTWRRYDSDLASPVDEFAASYRRICRRIRDELNARIVILEPFLLHVPQAKAAWRDDLNPRIDAVRAVAAELADLYLPLDGVFAAAACRREPNFWLPDGVHPSPAGHGLIADAWYAAVAR